MPIQRVLLLPMDTVLAIVGATVSCPIKLIRITNSSYHSHVAQGLLFFFNFAVGKLTKSVTHGDNK